MSTKHISGTMSVFNQYTKWHVLHQNPLCVQNDKGQLVAETGGNVYIDNATHKAHAKAIGALPELVAALRDISERGPIEGYGSQSALMLRLAGTQSIARSALAKIES